MKWPVLRRLIKELLPHKKSLIIVGLTGILMSLAMAQMAILIKNMVDALQESNQAEIIRTPILVLGLALIAAVARYYHYFLMNYTGELVSQDLRTKLQQKFMNLNLGFHNSYGSGSGGLITRILADISMIQTGLRLFADLFREPLQLILLVGWLFWLNWKLTLTIIVVLPIILKFLRQVSKSVQKYSHQSQEALEKLTATVKETLDGVRVIQSFNLEKEMEKRFENEFRGYLEARRRSHARLEVAGPVTEFIATAVVLCILLFMSLEITHGQATYGTFASYLAGLLMLSKPMKVLQDAVVRSQVTLVSAKRVFDILDEQSEVPQAHSNQSFPKNWQALTYKNVSFSYGHQTVLKNINLTVRRGEVVALVGESGSGKSTLVNLLERFYDPTNGQILIDQTSIDEIQLQELRANIALVTQDVYLFRDTVENNIWSGDFSKSKLGVEAAAQAANAHSFIMKSPQGYQSLVGERGNLFSGGEKQRLSIARAIFKDAPILILDEATSALDSASEAEVQKGLDQLMQGRTVFVIAHRLSTVAKADRIIVLKDGEIIEHGTQQDLLNKKGEYFKIHQLQFTN